MIFFPHLIATHHLKFEVYLEISRAFNRVWHEGLIYKIQSTGISGTPLKLFKSFLSVRFQHVIWNTSPLSNIFMVTNNS